MKYKIFSQVYIEVMNDYEYSVVFEVEEVLELFWEILVIWRKEVGLMLVQVVECMGIKVFIILCMEKNVL